MSRVSSGNDIAFVRSYRPESTWLAALHPEVLVEPDKRSVRQACIRNNEGFREVSRKELIGKLVHRSTILDEVEPVRRHIAGRTLLQKEPQDGCSATDVLVQFRDASWVRSWIEQAFRSALIGIHYKAEFPEQLGAWFVLCIPSDFGYLEGQIKYSVLHDRKLVD